MNVSKGMWFRGMGAALGALVFGCANVAGYDDLTPTGPGGSGAGLPGTGGGGGGGFCVSSEQCTNDNAGIPHVCRADGEGCVPLLSSACHYVMGDYLADDALIYGFIAPNSGSPAERAFGFANQCALTLAHQTITATTGGLPNPSRSTSSPLVFVSCDEADAVGAANHLVGAIGVAGIVGPSSDAAALAVATGVTIPNDVVLVSPHASSVSLTQLTDDGLVWGLTHSDISLAGAYQAMVASIEAELEVATPGVEIRVALVASSAPTALEMADQVIPTLFFNGMPAASQNDAFNHYVYEADGDVAPVVASLVAFNPHLVLAIDPEQKVVSALIAPTENVDAVAPDPIWVLGAPDPAAPLYLQGALLFPPPPGVEDRLRALGPRPPEPDVAQTFALLYAAACPELVSDSGRPLPSAAYTYDAAMLLAAARLAANNHDLAVPQLTGSALALGLSSLAPSGQLVPLMPSSFTSLVSSLVVGADLDVHGASSDLDFDIATGTMIADGAQVLCMSPGTNFPTSADWAFAGQTFDAASGTLLGTYDCPANP